MGNAATLHTVDSKPVVVAGRKEKIVAWVKKNVTNLALALYLIFAAGVMCIDESHALEIQGMDDLKGLATTIVGTLGFIVGIYGGVQFGLGMSNDNPDSQSRGLKMLIGGVIIGGSSVLLKALKLV